MPATMTASMRRLAAMPLRANQAIIVESGEWSVISNQ
jgi:hypothetical protein